MVVYPGLNIKAFCDNSQCDSNKSKLPVWIKKGYGEFDIGRETTKNCCPCCGMKLSSKSIRTLGYMKAEVRFEGSRLINDNDEEFTFRDSEKKGFFVKFNDFDQNMCKWTHLTVKVEKNK
jgi:hypothetical protein